MAMDNFDKEKLDAIDDMDALKAQFTGSLEGQSMTADVMDTVLARFNVEQYVSKGSKFDPTMHEAVFTVKDPAQENDIVAVEMQTGWKIGEERILRAAKVGIVKN